MSKITIGIYDDHKITQQGIESLLKNNEDFEVQLAFDSKKELFNTPKAKALNILIINLHQFSTQFLNLLMQINISFQKMKVLIISVHEQEEIILKTIKAGAKGFLSRDAERHELAEAIYTLRNGFDYYSKSITNLLLNKYISKLKSDDKDNVGIKSLSLRELEILELWGSSYTNKEIAEKLFISVRTVESHKNHIMQKLNLKTSVDLVKFAIKNNIIKI